MFVRPAHLHIDLSAIRHNLDEVRRIVGPQVATIAVVKADAYGHGALPVSRVALAAGAEMLAVALLEEGVELREAGIMAPLLVMGAMLPEQADDLVASNLTPSVMNLELAEALSHAATTAGRTLNCHLKVDTGMSRLGVRWDTLPELLPALARLPGLHWEGIFSHLADPTDDPKATQTQIARLAQAIEQATAVLGPLPYRHISGSGGICLHESSFFTAVRPGEMMYGLVAGVPETLQRGLREAMSLHTRVAFLKRVRTGERVSYGGTYEVPADTTLAVIPIGYADGYPRSLSGVAEVLIGGRRRPLVGRVCMDCILADVGPQPDCGLGDEVVVFGRQGEAEVRISEISRLGQTINQEIVARMGCRLPRVYLDV
jgi:alanine racemase